MTGCLSDLHEALRPAITVRRHCIQYFLAHRSRASHCPLNGGPASASELQDSTFLPKSLYLILAREVTMDTRIPAQVKQRSYAPKRPFLSDSSLKKGIF